MNFMTGKKALVTGAMGHAGSFMVDLLVKEGWKVVATDLPTSKRKLLMTKEQIYFNEIARYIEDYLKRVSDKDLLAKGAFNWFSSRLEKFVYLIRHNTYHLGELTMVLRVRGFDRIKWV